MQNHQIGSQIKGRAPSSINVFCQPTCLSSAAVTGADATIAIGWQRFQYAFARARSERGNQFASKTVVAGNTPLSATPRKNRATWNWPKVLTSPQPIAQIPHATRKMLMTFRALQREAKYPPGNCRST